MHQIDLLPQSVLLTIINSRQTPNISALEGAYLNILLISLGISPYFDCSLLLPCALSVPRSDDCRKSKSPTVAFCSRSPSTTALPLLYCSCLLLNFAIIPLRLLAFLLVPFCIVTFCLNLSVSLQTLVPFIRHST